MNTQVTKAHRMHPVTLLSRLMLRKFRPNGPLPTHPRSPQPQKPARRLSGFFDLL